nr:CvpA family protein [Alkalibacter mobilis]
MIFGIFLFYFIMDFNRGLVDSLASVFSFLISLVAATALYKTIYAYIVENTEIYENLYGFIKESFNKGDSIGQNGIEKIDISKLPAGAREYIENLAVEAGNMDMGFDFVASIADMILYLMCFVGVFLIVRVVIFMVAGIFDFIAKLPVLNVMNKLGGAAMGIIEGGIVSLIVVNSIYTLAILFSMDGMTNALNNSNLAQYFYIGYLFL